MAGRWSRARDGDMSGEETQMPDLEHFRGNEEQSWEISWKRNSKSATARRKGNYTSYLIQVIFSALKSEKAGLTKRLLHFLKHTSSLTGSCAVAFPVRSCPSPAQTAHPDMMRAHSHPASTTMARKEPTPSTAARRWPHKTLGPAGQGRWLFPSAQHWLNHTWSTRSSSGLQSTRLTRILQSHPRKCCDN